MKEFTIRMYFPKEEIGFVQSLLESLEGDAMILFTFVNNNLGVMDVSFDERFLPEITDFLSEVAKYIPLIYEPLEMGNA